MALIMRRPGHVNAFIYERIPVELITTIFRSLVALIQLILFNYTITNFIITLTLCDGNNWYKLRCLTVC
jgi:hypothetical protein